jgi:NAD(P)H-dependent FMN reductase
MALRLMSSTYPMPFFAEPISPRYNPNRDPHPDVQKWLDKLAAQDAYIFVTPEYNHSIPGVLKNALDYVGYELKRKPIAVVSHGSVGGARATMHLKEILSEAMALPIQNAVALTAMIMSGGVFDEEGNLAAELKANPYGPQVALDGLLSELKWTSDALATARTATN